MELSEIVKNIEGINDRFASLIIKYVDNYINMSSNKVLAAKNIINQIKNHVTKIEFKDLGKISGCVDGRNSIIQINSNLEDRFIDNAFLHEFTHQISKNEYNEFDDDYNIEITIRKNLGLKVAYDEQAEFNSGERLRNWEIDGNNYAYNKGILLFDEWVTEWLANKMSNLNNVEIREDEKGFFRKKTCHGYDGSNVMNLMELVYGSENIANLITGFDLTEEERKCDIPIIEFHKLNEMIDSNHVLSPEEIEIFKNLKPKYMITPNITGLLVYYMSEYQKQDNLENYNIYLQKMLDVLIRTYNFRYQDRINNCKDIGELNNLYEELSIIQNSMMWNNDIDILNSLESFKIYEKMIKDFSNKSTELGINDEKFNSLYLSPESLLEKFKLEEELLKQSYNSSKKM